MEIKRKNTEKQQEKEHRETRNKEDNEETNEEEKTRSDTGEGRKIITIKAEITAPWRAGTMDSWDSNSGPLG